MAQRGNQFHDQQVAIGNRLRQLRKKFGLTQAQVASHLGIDQSGLSHLESRDDILVSTLRDYLEAVGAELSIAARLSKTDVESVIYPLDSRSTLRPDVVFSVKPEYSKKIIAGVKTVELRRRFPKLPAGTKALIYTTSPTRALDGIAEIEEVIKDSPSNLWKNFGNEACIRKSSFDDYFSGVEQGSAIKLRSARALNRKWDLEELRSKVGFEAPQSYLYATRNLRDALKHECPELSH